MGSTHSTYKTWSHLSLVPFSFKMCKRCYVCINDTIVSQVSPVTCRCCLDMMKSNKKAILWFYTFCDSIYYWWDHSFGLYKIWTGFKGSKSYFKQSRGVYLQLLICFGLLVVKLFGVNIYLLIIYAHKETSLYIRFWHSFIIKKSHLFHCIYSLH